ncbi:MAG: ATP-dependent helicase [Chloroflexota bacterium]|nr:ATP-dependent helicase [Chloroflexota bacterium]
MGYELNEQQRRVALIDQALPLKVIAGAGTGKTETLAARFVELVRSGVAPGAILLLTFTEDAAAEMRARVMLRLHEAELELPPHAAMELWCHTFHGFAMRLIHQYGWALGLPPTPRVLQEEDQEALLDEIVAAWEDEAPAGDYRPLEHASYGWDNGEAWNKVLAVLTKLRGSGATPAALDPHPQLREQQLARFAAERAQLVPLIEHIHAAYCDHLHRAGLLDYDELIAAGCRLLERMPELARQFAVVMVDEFQDTNPAQLDLLARLRPDWSTVTVVGDPRQAIYGWRSARPDSLRTFPYEQGRPHVDQPLQQNYRSRRAICEIANLSLMGSELEGEAPLVAGREAAPAHPALLAEPDVSLHLLPTVDDEARLVAAEMRRLIAAGLRPSEMALLLRARTHLSAFTAALEAADVPYILNSGSGFFRQPAVRLVASLLQLLLDPEDHGAAVHVLESPLIGVDLRLLIRPDPGAAESAVRSPAGWLADPESVPAGLPDRAAVVARLTAFQRFYSVARARSLLLAPSDFLAWLSAASGLEEWWRSSADYQALRDLDKLVALADEWRGAQPGLSVAGYAAQLRKRVVEQPPEPVPVERTPHAVEITTVHGAKGREWPVVFVADTGLPSVRAGQVEHVLWDEQWKLVISDGKTASKGGAPDPLGDLRRDMRRRKRNEERAIWYVALTRARDRLVVTHSGCEVDEQAHFEDARAKREREQEAPEDEAVHFFHELWELVRAERERLGEAVFWGPGHCSGAPAIGGESGRKTHLPDDSRE